MAAHTDAIPSVRPPKFYVVLSLVCAFVAFAGFTPTYLARVAVGEFSGPAILHLHGVLFFAWTVLFVVQASLAKSSLRTHRSLGLAGISLATAMFFTAVIVIVRSLGIAVESGTEASARALSVVPAFAIGAFATFFAFAIANVRQSENHKRFMVLATVALMPPAIARLLFQFFAPPDAALLGLAGPVPDVAGALNMILVPAVLANTLLVAAAAYDWRTRGRPHRVYVIGGLALFATQALRPWVAQTEAWQTVTTALIALGQ